MKIYITKYALTAGIKDEDAEASVFDECATVKKLGDYPKYFYGNDWHATKEAAICQAEMMRIKKIASLNKQIAKLEKLKF